MTMISVLRKYFYVIVFMVVMIFTSCNRSITTDKIDDAETKIEIDDNPGAALSILQSMCYDSIQSDADKARYGYLYARSIHKLNQQMDSDLYIKHAVDYYRSKGDSPELMKSLFYYSNYLFENGLSEAAMRTLMKSRQLAIKYKDDYWRAKTAELLALILSSGHNYQEAIKYNQEAIKFYCKNGRDANTCYSYIDLAVCYGNILQFNRCLEITDSILQIATNECDSSLMAYCYKTKYEFYFDMKEYRKAEESLYKYISTSRYLPISQRDIAYKAWLFSKNNNTDSALNILTDLQKQNYSLKVQGIIFQVYRDIYKNIDNYEKAFEYSDSLLQTVDSLSRISHTQLLVAAQRDYLDEDLKLAGVKTAKQRYLLIMTAVIAVVVILGIILFYQYRLKIKRLDNEKRVNDIITAFNSERCKNVVLEQTIQNQEGTLAEMSNRLSVNLLDMDGLRNEIQNLYRKQWSLLNELCYEYFEKRDSDKLRTYIFNRIEDELNKFRSDLKMDEIIKSIDSYMDGLAGKFIEECDFFNEGTRRFVLLIFAGFSPRTICLFMGFKQKNYYAKKRIIINKIAESNVADRAMFLRYLE